MPFAQLVLGPPGSGKSTYCDGMHQFMGAIGRKCSVVNLDPANDQTSYPCALDVRDLITLDEIMTDEELGPNGGVLYALEELEHNIDWLEQGLGQLGGARHIHNSVLKTLVLEGRCTDYSLLTEDYILFDCPGQVELFTHHSSLRNIFFRLQKLGYRLVVLHLTDSYTLTLPSLYISTLLLSLRAMLQMDLPHLNVLTKIDKLSQYTPLPFNLDYYTEVQDLSYLLPHLADESPALQNARYEGLNKAIVELVEDFGLVGFETLAVEDKKSMMTLLHAIDRAGGYAFGGAEGANDTVWQVAMREGMTTMDIRDVQERWLDAKDEWDELERGQRKEDAEATGQIRSGELDDRDSLDGNERTGAGMSDSGIKIIRKR
ncbi:MAG: hypothetical protein M1835_005018 [Candelina submexicana]|nr:MAG: hypothetical protein M1835_005018 [Candelina submexicana]